MIITMLSAILITMKTFEKKVSKIKGDKEVREVGLRIVSWVAKHLRGRRCLEATDERTFRWDGTGLACQEMFWSRLLTVVNLVN